MKIAPSEETNTDLIYVISNGKLTALSSPMTEIDFLLSGVTTEDILALAYSLHWKVKYMAEALNVTKRSLSYKKSKRMNKQISENALEIARVSMFAIEYFDSIDHWNYWLSTPHVQFYHHPPRRFLSSILGRKLMKQIINELRYSFTA